MKKLIFLALFPLFSYAQFKTQYPDIPRIDVHTHCDDLSGNSFVKFLEIRDSVKRFFDADVAMWVNLTQNDVDIAFQKTGGRMLSAFSSYRPAVTGIEYYKPEDISKFRKAGYIGYKIWCGPSYRQNPELVKYPHIDDPVFETPFSMLESQGVFLTSLHIADPNGPIHHRTNWAADPIKYWRDILALERVLHRHPNLNIVVAHGFWLMTQDAQIDFLRYIMETYPKCNLDLSATINYVSLSSYDNLRDFYIQYQDRLCWSLDMTIKESSQPISYFINHLGEWFRFLETDDVFGENVSHDKKPLKGLNLPREVLEKIYYKNALRIYPEKLKESMKRLGYAVE